jgi:hypothetical protein
MHAVILQPINEYDKLARLFDNYQRFLLSYERVITPRESMAALVILTGQEGMYDTKLVAELTYRHYHLMLGVQALRSFYQCVSLATLELEEFLSEGADFQLYAANARMQDAELFGYTDEQDLDTDGGALRLRLGKPEALAPFQLQVVLAKFFPGSSPDGEKIGSSGPADFAVLTNIVRNEIVFALRNPAGHASTDNLTTYKMGKAHRSGLEEIELVDDRFEIEPDHVLSGATIAQQFNEVLELGQQAAKLYASLQGDDVVGYRQLYDLLQGMLDSHQEQVA